MTLELDNYRRDAELFCEQLDREYYLHLAGHKRELEIEPIYHRHRRLFETESVASLRELASGADGDDARRLRYLLELAVHGHMGIATAPLEARIAELEAELEVQLDGAAIPYRAAPVEQANEPDADRRAAISDARDALLAEHLNPLHLEVLRRTHDLARELGWRSYREMCSELCGFDLDTLARQTRRFLEATQPAYAQFLAPVLDRGGLPPLGQLRRSDLPRLFRAPELDASFPDSALVESFSSTLAGLGIDLGSQSNVHLDTEARPTKSPRAFCSPARVPDEVYLVVSPIGGRDDYATLFHEGGHTEHYANTDRALEFEFRHLGDNSVTESYAFLLEGLTSNPAWLGTRLGVPDAVAIEAHTRVVRLVFLRRYAAKLDYELALHDAGADLEAMPERYAGLVSDATAVAWPAVSWLSDTDPAFYVASYLRAWALDAIWRRALAERFGEHWFEQPGAGRWLRELWAQGQRLRADELLAETLGEELDFRALAAEFSAAA